MQAHIFQHVPFEGPGSILPWLKREKAFIREAVETGVPILGICLGAQLIASSLGAKVTHNPEVNGLMDRLLDFLMG